MWRFAGFEGVREERQGQEVSRVGRKNLATPEEVWAGILQCKQAIERLTDAKIREEYEKLLRERSESWLKH